MSVWVWVWTVVLSLIGGFLAVSYGRYRFHKCWSDRWTRWRLLAAASGTDAAAGLIAVTAASALGWKNSSVAFLVALELSTATQLTLRGYTGSTTDKPKEWDVSGAPTQAQLWVLRRTLSWSGDALQAHVKERIRATVLDYSDDELAGYAYYAFWSAVEGFDVLQLPRAQTRLKKELDNICGKLPAERGRLLTHVVRRIETQQLCQEPRERLSQWRDGLPAAR